MIEVAPYEASAALAWDELVRNAPMGTLLQSRRFLGYHGSRFEDASVMLHEDSGRLVAVMPAALDPTDRTIVVSHPGATYGGLVHDGSLVGARMLDALRTVRDHYRNAGYTLLRYAAVPTIYHRQPSGDDVYALFRLGAGRTRCDLACAVDLETGPRLSARRRRGLRKAVSEGVEIAQGGELVGELWPIVESNLMTRHRARPVHDASEMRLLVDLFPDAIKVVLARLRTQPAAGVIVFESSRVTHVQYSASTNAGREAGALDAVLDRCISNAAARGARFFDFGTSNRDEGRTLNSGLFEFKAQFGGGGVPYEFFELALDAAEG